MYSQKYSTLKIWPKIANLCIGGRKRVNLFRFSAFIYLYNELLCIIVNSEMLILTNLIDKS